MRTKDHRCLVRKVLTRFLTFFAFGLAFSWAVPGQADDICREFGETPSRESSRDNRLVPFVYGRIIVRPTGGAKRITVIYSDSMQPALRQVLGRSGNYCFAKRGTGAILVIDIDGTEAARKNISDISNLRQREDFELVVPSADHRPLPGVISAQTGRKPNEKTIELYRNTAVEEAAGKIKDAIDLVRQIVEIDPTDHIAWAKLGSLHLLNKETKQAETAFERSLAIRPDYVPAMVNLGIQRALAGDFQKAIQHFGAATKLEPTSARNFRLLGEAYLQNRQGSLGLAALDRALEIDPIGMAECHLLKARLFDLVGAKNLASAEYKMFLQKVTDHPESKRFAQYIRDNPPN